MKLARQPRRWSKVGRGCLFFYRSVPFSMNRTPGNRLGSGSDRLEYHTVLAGEFLQQALLGSSDFLFIFLESLFDISPAMNDQPPEQFGQFARQCYVGHQTAKRIIGDE